MLDNTQPSNYTEQERKFLMRQAESLKNNQQSCELHTRTVHSIYRGRVLQADEGGIVFEQESGEQVTLPISLVEKFISIPNTWGANQQARGAGQQRY